MDRVIVTKVGCGALVGVYIMVSGMLVDKSEINVPPNYFEPHEAPSNNVVPQRHNEVVVASTATSGTVNTIGTIGFPRRLF